MEIQPQMFKLILDSIVWAYKHTMRNVNDTGLEIMLQLLKNIESRGAQGQVIIFTLIKSIMSLGRFLKLLESGAKFLLDRYV